MSKLLLPRRKFIIGAAAGICAPYVKRSRAAFFSFNGPGFPGQPGNPVGYAAGPLYSGSLTNWSAGFSGSGVTSNQTYNNFNINMGTTNNFPVANVGVTNVEFNSCLFQCNRPNMGAIVPVGGPGVTSTNIRFKYCTFAPLVSQHPTPPVPGAWPSAGAITNAIGQPNDATGNFFAYQIPWLDSYQIAVGAFLNCNVLLDHCDIWGAGNAVTFVGGTGQQTVTDCWIHDMAAGVDNVTYPLWNVGTSYPTNATVSVAGGGIYQTSAPVTGGSGPPAAPWSAIGVIPNYHTDGPGYLNSGAPPWNVLVQHCTIGSLGSQDFVAFQGTSATWLVGTAYVVNQTVRGSDGNSYQCAISNTGINPVGDVTGHWTLQGPNYYQNIQVINNYLTGFIAGLAMGVGTFVDPLSNNMIVTDNIFATDINFDRVVDATVATQFVGNRSNIWRRNRFRVVPGTSHQAGASLSWTGANDGNFVLPDGSLSTSDWNG